MKRILVIQNVDREKPSLFKDVAMEMNIQMITYLPFKGEELPDIRLGDCLLVLGGPMGIRDISNKSYPWLSDLFELVKYVINNNIPYIGVCFGAQLLAYASGGSISDLRSKSDEKKIIEIGWSTLYNYRESYDSIYDIDFDSNMWVLHWHGDRIFLPTNATLLASSLVCDEQFFLIGKSSIGLQFHAEIKENDVNEWISEDKVFIEKGLGVDGQKILTEESKKYCNKSISIRKEFIYSLYKYLNSLHK